MTVTEYSAQPSETNMELEPDAPQFEQPIYGGDACQVPYPVQPDIVVDIVLPDPSAAEDGNQLPSGNAGDTSLAVGSDGSEIPFAPFSSTSDLSGDQPSFHALSMAYLEEWFCQWLLSQETVNCSSEREAEIDSLAPEPALNLSSLPPSPPVDIVEDPVPEDPIAAEFLPVDEHPCVFGMKWELLWIYAGDEYDTLFKGVVMEPSMIMEKARRRYCSVYFPNLFGPPPEDAYDGVPPTEPELAQPFKAGDGQETSQPATGEDSSSPSVDDSPDLSCPDLSSTNTSRESTESPQTPVQDTPPIFEPFTAGSGKGAAPFARKLTTIEEVDE